MKARLVTIGVSMSILVLSSLLYADARLTGCRRLDDGWSDFSEIDSGYATLGGQTNLEWHRATEAAAWARREDPAFLSYDDRMWVISGDATGSLGTQPNDVWWSVDGTNWTLATDNAPWTGRRDFVGLVYDGRMWLIGGVALPYVKLGDVWSSTDGTNWTQATGAAGWMARGQHSGVVYDGKMWIFGGVTDSGNTNDVWSSTDGSNWTCVTTGAPWTARRGHASVVYEDKMWVMGGRDNSGLVNDVWWSADGTNWSEATNGAAWSPRQYQGVAAYDGVMWLTGGGLDGSWEANDVWFSTNGAAWVCDTEHAPWASRYGHGLLVHKGRMWLAGGGDVDTGHRFNDVWYAGEAVPAPPLDVQASDGDYTNKVEITWSSSEDATKYTVYRNTINNSSAAVDVSGEISTTRYYDVSVTPEQVYYYWVKAGDSNGWSGFSDSDSGYAGAGFAAPTVSPSFIDFSSNLTTRFIYLGNNGTLPYTFTATVSAGSAWLSVLPDNGTVSNETIALSATADRSSLGDGTYEGYITVSPSVGDQFAVTAQVVVAGNTVVAEANGPYATDQGSPVTFSAAGSQGNALLYRWEVDALITPYSSEYASYTYTNTMVPGTYDVLLTVRDTNSPPHIAADSTTLTINNVPPTVDIGGPYQGSTTNPVFFAATVTDPGLLDAHEYRWDFENDGTWDTGWLNSNTIAHTYTAGGNYLVQCEARDNHGGVGSDSATVIVDQPNVPPVADAVIHGTTQTETNLPGLGYTVTLDGSGSYDPDAKPLPLYYDWREDVENPVKPLILESNRHDQIVTTQPLTKPGVYQFHLVVFDGEYNSEPATVTVRVPGWEGEIICDGFMAKVPLWGVNVIVSNTYTHQMDDSSRTDTEGYFLADSGAGYQVARLSRRDRDQFKPINIDTAGTFTENIYFLPNYYIYAGQVVTGSPGNYVGMMDVEVEVLLGNGLSSATDLLGAFGFGSIPESWPLDGAPYKVRVQKEGFKSEVHDLLLTMDRNSEMILMTPSAGMIDVSGTVYSAQSGLPVEEVAVDFGCGWCVTSGADGAYGPVAMPEGEYAVKLSRDGFDDTYTYPSELNASTELNLAIEGGEVSVYGVVYDGSGMVITDATISVVESVSGLRLGSSTGATGEKATGAGYFDVTVAKGARTLVISAPGYESTEMSLDVNDHTKRNVILIPEPCLMTFVCLALGLLLRRIQID